LLGSCQVLAYFTDIPKILPAPYGQEKMSWGRENELKYYHSNLFDD